MDISSEYSKRIYIALKEHPEWRAGQAAFNVAYAMNHAIAEKFRGGELDPFYNNSRTRAFMEAFVMEANKNPIRCVFWNWEGPFYGENDLYFDIKRSVELLGKEGPLFATCTENNDVVISTDPNAEKACDVRDGSPRNVAEILNGEELQVCETWEDVIDGLPISDDDDDGYLREARKAIKEESA